MNHKFFFFQCFSIPGTYGNVPGLIPLEVKTGGGIPKIPQTKLKISMFSMSGILRTPTDFCVELTLKSMEFPCAQKIPCISKILGSYPETPAIVGESGEVAIVYPGIASMKIGGGILEEIVGRWYHVGAFNSVYT